MNLIKDCQAVLNITRRATDGLCYLLRRFLEYRWRAMRCLALFAWVLALSIEALAINASPHSVELTQPDGTKVTLYPKGDEFSHWFEDDQSYTVVRNGREYVYASLDSTGWLAPTKLLVGHVNPATAGLIKGLKPSTEALRNQRLKALPPEKRAAAAMHSLDGMEPPTGVPPVGTVKNLVVLCKFSNHIDGVQTRVASDYDKIFNAIGGDPVLAPTGSVKDYFLETSYGIVTIQSTVIAWVTLPRPESYYANGQDGLGTYPQNAQGMVEDALNLVDALVDFGQFDTDRDGFVDAIDFIHSGYGAETGGGGGNWIWSHKWSLWALAGGRWTSQDNNANGVKVKVYDYHTEPALWGTSGTDITRIGVISHETGHFFGLPDLYDTDGSSEGIGSYCLMANSWGFNGNQRNPPHLSAWGKITLGWITPTVIASGSFTAPQVETTKAVFKVTAGYGSNEYLLIENRQPVGFESVMPQGGLAIWHIDESKPGNTEEGYPGQSGWPTNNRHYKVALLQADGRYDLEHGFNRGDAGDVYHGGGKNAITPSTVPNTDRYQGGTVATTNNAITNISAAGQVMTFTLSRTGSLPNLTPYTPSNWSDKIVVSTGAGTNTDSVTMRSTDTLYVDWAAINNGDGATAARFFTELYVDDVLKQTWYSDPPVNPNSYVFVTDYVIGTLPAGTHSIRIKTDSSGVIGESNEGDNEYTKTVTVSGTYTIALSSSPSAGGSTTGAGTYTEGTSVTVTATPASGYTFVNWTESAAVVSTSPSYTFTVTRNRTLVANFVQSVNYTITLAVSPPGGGTVSGAGMYPGGSSRTVTAEAAAGYRFVNWTENGAPVSASTSYTFTLTADRNLTANFTVVSGQSIAERTLPAGYVPGSGLTVTINVTPAAGVSAYAVEDMPPTGWVATNISNGGIWDSVNLKVKWGPFFDSTSRVLSYQVTPPAGSSGVKTFAGSASFDGVSVAIGGNSSIDLAQGHPGDYPGPDMRLVINEVTAYGSAWKQGANWPLPPNPIDVNYVTRAGYLWKNGEVYHFDPTQPPPLCWEVGPASGPGKGLRSLVLKKKLLQPSLSATGQARRVVPHSRLGTAMPVTIAVEPEADVSSYALEDRPPRGWVVTEIDHGGVWDPLSGTVKWGPFLDNMPRALSYRATPLSGAAKANSFEGRASFDGASVAVGGAGAKLTRGSARDSFRPVAGTYHGLIRTQPLQSRTSGSIKLDVNARGGFSAAVFYGGIQARLHGVFAQDGTFAGALKAAGQRVARIYLYLDVTAGTGQLSGYLDDGVTLPGLLAERRAYNGSTLPSPQAGRYPLELSPESPLTATVDISISGKVRVKGALSDGRRFIQTSALSAEGTWPFYLNLQQDRGCALGFVTVQPEATPALDSHLIESPHDGNASLSKAGPVLRGF